MDLLAAWQSSERRIMAPGQEGSAEAKRMEAQELKKAGNDAFARGDWKTAVDHFTGAIRLDPADQVFYSNRSGAYANLARYQEALQDAKKCVELKPDWWKAWSRKGHAEYHLNDFGASEQSYEEGIRLNPQEKSLTEGRDKARAAQRGTSLGDMQKLSTAEIAQRLRQGLEKLSVEDLRAEMAKANLKSAGKSREEMIELLVKTEAPRATTASSGKSGSCLARCFPEKKYLTPGEKNLERRRKLLAKWKDWDEAKLRKRLKSLGEDAEVRCDDRDELVDVLLQAEMKHLEAKGDPQRMHKYGVYVAVAVMLVTFLGLAAFFVLSSGESSSKSETSGVSRRRRLLRGGPADPLRDGW